VCPPVAGLSYRRAVLWILCGLAGPALAADGIKPAATSVPSRSAPVSASRQLDFDIPAQPLVTALYQYGDISRQPALFDTDMIAGRTSSGVRGRYTPEAALHQLLQGTGLAAEKLHSEHGETFVLKESGNAAAMAQTALPGIFDTAYPGLIQAGIWQMLCADPRIAPGDYSFLFRFRVDASGRIISPQLLGTTGDAQRDRLLMTTLRRVKIDQTPPPAVVQQPLTMLLLPIDQDRQRCDQQPGAF